MAKNRGRVSLNAPETLIAEIDRRVDVARMKDPETKLSRNAFVRIAVREYLRRHPA